MKCNQLSTQKKTFKKNLTLSLTNKFNCLPFLLLISICLNAQKDYSQNYLGREYIKKGIELNDNDKTAEAIIEYAKVDKTDPDYLEAQYETALSLYTSDKIDESIILLESLYSKGLMADYPPLFAMYGICLSDKKEYDLSEQMFKKAEEFIPNSTFLLYNISLLYIRKSENQAALDYLKKLITVNPNHSSAQYLLGLMAYEDGKVAEGSLCMISYLVNSPTGYYAADAILKLNTKMGSDFLETPKLVFSDKGDDFSELELILRNELPLNPKYKVKSTIDEAYTRQVQAILEYAATHKIADGFFENIYIPWMADIANKNLTESFIYYSLVSLEETLGKTLTSQKKKVDSFVQNYILKDFWELYGKRNLDHFGKKEDVVVYLNDGLPHFIGKTVNGKNHGKFKVIDGSGKILSELNYKDGELDGLQHYYYVNGQKSDEINYTNGVMNGAFKSFYKNGSIKSSGSYINDKMNGAFMNYYPNGGKVCDFNYKDDVRNGKGVCYFPSGNKKSEYNYDNGKVNGTGVHYNEAGDVTDNFTYKDNWYEGEGISYFDGKNIKTKANYKAGEVIDNLKEYFENGSIKKEFFYVNGKIIKSAENYPNGKLYSEAFYNEKGEMSSYVYYDEEGQKVFEEKYKNGVLEKGFQYSAGKPDPVETSFKNKPFTIYFLNGDKMTTGQYEKGKMNGEWKFYYSNGQLRTKQTFVNDVPEGLRYDYEKNGDLSSIYHQSNKEANGLYEDYKHNKLNFTMYLKDGNTDGPYQYYYENGNLEREGFVTEDNKTGTQYIYYLDGSLKRKEQYIDNYLINIKNYHKNGTLLSEFDSTAKTGEYEFKTNNGLVVNKFQLTNGVKNGKETIQTTDGELIFELNYLNEKLNGTYKAFHPNGKIRAESTFYNGNKHGESKYYDVAGNLRYTSNNIFGKEYGTSTVYYHNQQKMTEYDVLNDLQIGEQTFYNLEGKPVAAIGYQMDVMKYYRVLDANGNLGDPEKINRKDFVIHSGYPNGKTAFKFTVKDNLREGVNEIYSENGKLNYSVNYAKNNLNGVRTEYYQNGNIYKRENFINSDFQGLQEFFAEDGKLLYSAEYYFDNFHGDFKIFDNGKLVKTKKYDSDELIEIIQQ